MQYMSANKDQQPDGPGRRCRSNPALGPLGEINLGSTYGFGTNPTGNGPRSAAKPPADSQAQGALSLPTRTPIPEFGSDPIIFASRSATLSQQGIASTALVVAFLAAAPVTVHLTIKGYSDIIGEAEQNLVLSQQRADAVAAVLLNQNIAMTRLTAEGHGATDQFAARQHDRQNNNSYQTLRANRRVHMELAIDLG